MTYKCLCIAFYVSIAGASKRVIYGTSVQVHCGVTGYKSFKTATVYLTYLTTGYVYGGVSYSTFQTAAEYLQGTTAHTVVVR